MHSIPTECSFCGRGKNEVEFLLPGLVDAAICSVCLEQGFEFQTFVDAAAGCDFCGTRRKEALKPLSGEDVSICSDCLFILSSPPSAMIRGGFIISPATRIGNWLLNSDNRFIKKYIVGK